MRTFLIAAASLLACSSAFAQSTANSPSQQNSQMASPQVLQGGSQSASPQAQQDSQSTSQAQGQQATVKIAEQIKSNLEQAGFKNIKLMPSAFIVQANDQNNNPVVMVVNPGSITTVGGTKDHNTIGQSLGASPGNDSDNANGNDSANSTAQPGH